MTTSHTPGPWVVIDPAVKQYPRAVQSARMTSDAKNGGFVSAMCPGPHAEANARLIAAAPDMLAALQAINAALTQPVQFSGTNSPGTANILRGDCQVAASIARAAIAKATGGADR